MIDIEAVTKRFGRKCIVYIRLLIGIYQRSLNIRGRAKEVSQYIFKTFWYLRTELFVSYYFWTVQKCKFLRKKIVAWMFETRLNNTIRDKWNTTFTDELIFTCYTLYFVAGSVADYVWKKNMFCEQIWNPRVQAVFSGVDVTSNGFRRIRRRSLRVRLVSTERLATGGERTKTDFVLCLNVLSYKVYKISRLKKKKRMSDVHAHESAISENVYSRGLFDVQRPCEHHEKRRWRYCPGEKPAVGDA